MSEKNTPMTEYFHALNGAFEGFMQQTAGMKFPQCDKIINDNFDLKEFLFPSFSEQEEVKKDEQKII